MPTAKVAISLDRELLARLDQLVAEHRFPNRSQAIGQAVRETIERLDRTHLARECAKLDPSFEQQLAEEGLAEEAIAWPEY